MITALKEASLANTPCSTERVISHSFTIDNYEEVQEKTARERLIGLTNRVVAGMLLQTVRTETKKCEGSRCVLPLALLDRE